MRFLQQSGIVLTMRVDWLPDRTSRGSSATYKGSGRESSRVPVTILGDSSVR